MTPDEILTAIQRKHTNLVDALADISDADLVTGQLSDAWTVKDLMAHVALWYRVAIKFIAEYKREGAPKPLGLKDDAAINAYNQREIEMRRAWTLAQVRDEFDAAYRNLLAVVRTLSDADLQKPLPMFDWQAGTATLEQIIAANSYEHEPEHTAQVNRFKTRLRGE